MNPDKFIYRNKNTHIACFPPSKPGVDPFILLNSNKKLLLQNIPKALALMGIPEASLTFPTYCYWDPRMRLFRVKIGKNYLGSYRDISSLHKGIKGNRDYQKYLRSKEITKEDPRDVVPPSCLSTRRKPSSVQHKGVSWDKKAKKFRATFYYKGRNYYLGLYDHKVDAIMQWKKADANPEVYLARKRLNLGDEATPGISPCKSRPGYFKVRCYYGGKTYYVGVTYGLDNALDKQKEYYTYLKNPIFGL